MAEESSAQVIARYSGIIASIANEAVEDVEGLSKEAGVVKYRYGLRALKDRNVHVYIDKDVVIIDMYVDVEYGFSVPDVVCQLQEKIKSKVETSTRFEVKKINVHVANIKFN